MAKLPPQTTTEAPEERTTLEAREEARERWRAWRTLERVLSNGWSAGGADAENEAC